MTVTGKSDSTLFPLDTWESIRFPEKARQQAEALSLPAGNRHNKKPKRTGFAALLGFHVFLKPAKADQKCR